ncbi:protein kinase domain-containing protein [Metaclostridioides mangenotii]|uniref:protein kinase domain-containing protein n=1 Tax=Metaclostridioides mangenotii TaxID=1540 RepID=UPI0028EA76F4|nr:protein kinase [Clostridioides mangenotii]
MKVKELTKIFENKFIDIKYIDSGGNASVYSVKKIGTDEMIALKILDTNGLNFNNKRKRFIIETNKVKQLQNDFKGIIPILEFGLPDLVNTDVYWYTMPMAQTINKHFNNSYNISEIVNCVISLAKTLSKLHDKNIVHRDIKPSNIYFYNNRYCLADFGLVDYPEKDSLTKTSEQIGAKATIAPEMKRNSKEADGKKADVYSLAKTLWMLLTESKFGFEGIYNLESPQMRLNRYYPKEHLVEITKLLIDSTQDEPTLRPTMKEFCDRLEEYMLVYNDFEKSNLSQWKFIQENLFGRNIPESANWRDINDIVSVINLVGSMPNLNHMFLPSGGGMNFNYAKIADEKGCIELHASNSIYIVKPSSLIIENINKDFKWSYFRLELHDLEPTDIVQVYDNREFLTEYSPGKYISWIYGIYGYDENSKPLPSGYRLVDRILSGSYVFFTKSSVYNHLGGAYDARHNKFNSLEFREYIKKVRKDSILMDYNKFMEKHNRNPFEVRTESGKEDIMTLVKNEKELKLLIKGYFNNTDFCDYLEQPGIKGDSNVLHFGLSVNFNEGMFDPDLLLKYNGKFIKDKSSLFQRESDSKDLFLFQNIKLVQEFMNNVENDIRNICVENEIDMSPVLYYFSIDIFRNRSPKHMFTRDEIKKVLLSGNDYKRNTLVIDSDGFPRLIEEEKQILLMQYPVIHESYDAYNNYTGKYSPLNHLEDEYISSLQGWLEHLKYGGVIRIEYVDDNTDEEQLIKEIIKYY